MKITKDDIYHYVYDEIMSGSSSFKIKKLHIYTINEINSHKYHVEYGVEIYHYDGVFVPYKGKMINNSTTIDFRDTSKRRDIRINRILKENPDK